MATEDTPTIQAQVREKAGTGVARQLRREGNIPAVCYGSGMENPMNLAVSSEAVIELFAHPKGRNVLFDLEVEGGQRVTNVMVKSYDVSPVKRDLLHADFYAVDMDEQVLAKVPLRSVGRPAGVKLGGMLNMIRPDIDIKARPSDIPAYIEVDVSELEPGHTIQAQDVVLPEGVAPGFRANYGLFRVVMPRKRAAVLAAGEEAPK